MLPPQRSVEADVNEDRALMRFELIEALLRVAITMRDNEGQDEVSPAEKVRRPAQVCTWYTFCQVACSVACIAPFLCVRHFTFLKKRRLRHLV